MAGQEQLREANQRVASGRCRPEWPRKGLVATGDEQYLAPEERAVVGVASIRAAPE